MNDRQRVGTKTLLTAAAAGLTGGFLLAIPLSRTLMPEADVPPLIPVSNPFSAWSVFDNREVLVLGVDEGGGNTDAIFTVRLEAGRTSLNDSTADRGRSGRRFA